MNLPESLTIDRTKELLLFFESAELAETEDQLDFDRVTNIDVAGIQILVSFCRDMAVMKKPFAFCGTVSPKVLLRMQNCGFELDASAAGKDIQSALEKCI